MLERIENKEYPDRHLKLSNRQGMLLNITLRKYRRGDEEGMIACIRDEYGENYFKNNFYNPDYLAAEAQNHITFLIAETQKDGIAGMFILKEFFPQETMCEMASMIFRKKYRGFGLAQPFFIYGMDIMKKHSYSAAFSLPVLFHNVTQRLLYGMGMRTTGFLLNVFDMDKITHSYTNGSNTKHSQGIQVMAADKKGAGTLFLPQEHRVFGRQIYGRLGVSYRIMDMDHPLKLFPGQESMNWISNFSCKNDDKQSNLEIRIHRVGRDLRKCMKRVEKSFPLAGKQTANVLLNINDVNAVWAYNILISMGYFFTGFKPLCSQWEYMVLHHPGKVKIFFDDYKVSSEAAPVLTYVKDQYNNRKRKYNIKEYTWTKGRERKAVSEKK